MPCQLADESKDSRSCRGGVVLRWVLRIAHIHTHLSQQEFLVRRHFRTRLGDCRREAARIPVFPLWTHSIRLHNKK